MMLAVVPPADSLPPLAVAVLLLASCAASPTLVDGDDASGFALYRSGQLSSGELAELCRLGVEEMVVLDGGGERECRMRERICPGLAIRYDQAQDARRPVDAEFLTAFDAWVEEARATGRKIALRCRHGWHRAGRLTAWYRMRFGGTGAEEAVTEMLQAGRFMDRHRQLVPQVHAMADLLAGRACRQGEHCVAGTGWPDGSAVFAPDTCP